MATKLAVYNEALRSLGDMRLTSLTEDVEARYALDDAWDNAVEFCFTEGLWNFATVTTSITQSGSITPVPGFQYGFNKPTSWLRTISVAPDAHFSVEAIYQDEGGKIYANFATLYIRYISGAKISTLTDWPPSFTKVVAVYLARQIAARVSGSKTDVDRLEEVYRETLATAKNKDALDQAKMVLKPGNWVRGMRSGGNIRDRGPLSGY